MEKPTFGRIVRNNLLVLLAAAIGLGVAAQFFGEGALMLFAVFYLGQALYNLVVALAQLGRGHEGVGAAPYFLSLLLVLIVGFGACSGLFVVSGSTGAIRL